MLPRLNYEADKRVLMATSGFGKRHLRPFASKSQAWDAAFAKVKARIANPDGSLVFLCGNRGNGKTQLGQAAVAHYLDDVYDPNRNGKPLYDRAMGFYLEVRASFKKESRLTELAALIPYVKSGLLVLDEINVRGETPWEDKLLTHMIDCRYADCRHTILISNLGPEAMVASVGESIADRLRETGGVIECTWPSFRG